MKKIISIILVIITIFMLLTIQNCTYATGHTAGEVISEGKSFITAGKDKANGLIGEDNLKALSNTIYNVLLVVGIIAAVLIGLILGIKFITEGVEGKVEVQKALVVYVLGCVVVFGAFTIWKIVVTVLNEIQ